MIRALVVGGTGQTGPIIVQGLLDRSFEVTVLHAGRREPPDLPVVEHIHTDAHFAEPLEAALVDRTFDVVIAMYGRSAVLADVLVGKTARLVCVTGTAYAYNTPQDPRWGPLGLTVASEESPFATDPEIDRLAVAVRAGEHAMLSHHEARHYDVTILRYPGVYGPHSVTGRDWTLVRRVVDGRPHFAIGDAGLSVTNSAYRDNAAHAVLLAVDQPAAAAGEIFNVGEDAELVTLGHRAQAMARALGHEWELVDMPHMLVTKLYRGWSGYHSVRDISKIRDLLGYADVVPVAEALERTAHWWAEHQPERGGEIERRLPDAFDYAAEDALIERYKKAIEDLAAMLEDAPLLPHPYRHPKRIGDEWDKDASRRIMARPGDPWPFTLWRPSTIGGTETSSADR